MSEAQSVIVTLKFADGTPDVSINESQQIIHANATGDGKDGYDVAIIVLDSAAPLKTPRYDIYRNTDEVDRERFNIAGFGDGGNGDPGGELPDGTKRDGSNRYDALAHLRYFQFFASIPENSGLLFDFDDGTPEKDAAGVWMGIDDLGLGLDEVGKATGDSGGPSFIDDRIAGTTSFAWSSGDTDDHLLIEGSFGEFVVDSRISWFAGWIDSQIDIIGPQVTGVSVGSTVSSHPDHDFAAALAAGEKQLQSVPVADADTFSITFSEDVSIDAEHFALTSAITGASHPLDPQNGFSYNSSTNTATFTLANPISSADQVVLRLLGGYDAVADEVGVTDIAGNYLNGEWAQMASLSQSQADQFTSGDDSPGGDFLFQMTFLPGDADRDNFVAQGDLDRVLLNWGLTPATWEQGDTSGNGQVEQADLGDVLLLWGTDFRDWPSGGGQQAMMGGGPGNGGLLAPSEDALQALEKALRELGLGAVASEVNLESRTKITAEAEWDALLSDLASALTEHYGKVAAA